jgi:hypothetical protein
MTEASDIFETMNATRILVAILKSKGEMLIPLDEFVNSNNQDHDLSVNYDEDLKSFSFKIVDKN